MPAKYEAIKRSELKSGKPIKTAERIAAATYNSQRPAGATPMGPNYESRARGHMMAAQIKGKK